MLQSDRAGCRGKSERGGQGFRGSNRGKISAGAVGGENSVIVKSCPDSCLDATIQNIIQWASKKKQVLQDKPRAVKDKFPAVPLGDDSSSNNNSNSNKTSKCSFIVYVNFPDATCLKEFEQYIKDESVRLDNQMSCIGYNDTNKPKPIMYTLMVNCENHNDVDMVILRREFGEYGICDAHVSAKDTSSIYVNYATFETVREILQDYEAGIFCPQVVRYYNASICAVQNSLLMFDFYDMKQELGQVFANNKSITKCEINDWFCKNDPHNKHKMSIDRVMIFFKPMIKKYFGLEYNEELLCFVAPITEPAAPSEPAYHQDLADNKEPPILEEQPAVVLTHKPLASSDAIVDECGDIQVVVEDSALQTLHTLHAKINNNAWLDESRMVHFKESTQNTTMPVVLAHNPIPVPVPLLRGPVQDLLPVLQPVLAEAVALHLLATNTDELPKSDLLSPREASPAPTLSSSPLFNTVSPSSVLEPLCNILPELNMLDKVKKSCIKTDTQKASKKTATSKHPQTPRPVAKKIDKPVFMSYALEACNSGRMSHAPQCQSLSMRVRHMEQILYGEEYHSTSHGLLQRINNLAFEMEIVPSPDARLAGRILQLETWL